jgi:TRAP-type uncharacterized transport system fused permease subunit
VALASYAGSTLAGGDFWKTSQNAVKYALAGYIGPFIYFMHPEMFIITVGALSFAAVFSIVYALAATLLVMFMLGVAITGWFKGHIRYEVRIILGILALAGVTLNYLVIGISVVLIVLLWIYGTTKFAKKEKKKEEVETS